MRAIRMTEGAVMQCLSCNKTISQKDRFCRYCGATITSAAIQANRLREDERFHSLLASSIAESRKQEISFGEFWLFDTKYFTPAQLARELRIDPRQAEVHQLDPEMDVYRIFSRGTFSDAPAAAAQARQIWDQSAMVERFAEKKVERARYGYQELETEYCVWLGWLEQKPWPHWTHQESRPAYMKDRAMAETLSHALDLNGYRKYFQVGFNLVPDDGLLWKLHYRRSRSKYVSSDAQSESQKWVQAHPIEEAFPLRKVKPPKPA
jgi:hypothetical protein